MISVKPFRPSLGYRHRDQKYHTVLQIDRQLVRCWHHDDGFTFSPSLRQVHNIHCRSLQFDNFTTTGTGTVVDRLDAVGRINSVKSTNSTEAGQGTMGRRVRLDMRWLHWVRHPFHCDKRGVAGGISTCLSITRLLGKPDFCMPDTPSRR